MPPPTSAPTTTTHQPAPSPTPKRCFTTTGATAPFPTLIKTILTPSFLSTLKAHNYTELRIQYGASKKTFDDYLWALGDTVAEYGVAVSGFEFDKMGLNGEMRGARGGVVVSHAGSGSILDALRIGAPLLVVPNPELMDNHQVELAEVLEEQQYVVHGKLDDLGDGIRRVEGLRRAMQVWPPVTATGKKGGLVKVVREEMGWVD